MSIDDRVKESNNPEALEVKKEIDTVKAEREAMIGKIKAARRRLRYKEMESASITKTLETQPSKQDDSAARKRLGYLKKMKNRLEFKVSTEASSLSDERDLIRNINKINAEIKELDGIFKFDRLRRKITYVKKDIEDFNNEIKTLNAKIMELDARLDGMYDRLRRILGMSNRRDRDKAHERPRSQKHEAVKAVDINLEDIAVVTRRGKKG
ncbi:MAG: hypothetical protein KGH98_04860 [Candidatus Micrarchaeota archaeon]|nr:hypothetical protein [Candidatus Micrarchaeota archaeon]